MKFNHLFLIFFFAGVFQMSAQDSLNMEKLYNWDDDARYTEENSFRSKYDIDGKLIGFDPYGPPYHGDQYLETYFLYEYPKAENISEAQKEYIQDYIFEFETALLTDDFVHMRHCVSTFQLF